LLLSITKASGKANASKHLPCMATTERHIYICESKLTCSAVSLFGRTMSRKDLILYDAFANDSL